MVNIDVLNIGYTLVNSKNNERIHSVPKVVIDPKTRNFNNAKELRMSVLLDKYPIMDYHLVLIKNSSEIPYNSIFLNKLGVHAGVIAIGVDSYYNIYPILKDYVEFETISGHNLVFITDNPLGKIFSRYSNSLRYGYTMKLSDKLINTSITVEAIKVFASALAKTPIKDEEFANSYYVEFAKNPGGETVGIMLKIKNTYVILHPILTDSNKEGAFTRDLLDVIETHLLGIQTNKEIPPAWVNQMLPEYEEKKNFAISSLNSILGEENVLRNLYWSTGDDLEEAVEYAFKKLGFEVKNIAKERNSRDLIITYNSTEYYVEVRGKEGIIDIGDISKFIANNPQQKLIFVGNPYRLILPGKRGEAYTKKAIETIKENISRGTIESFYLLTSLDLINFVKNGYKADAVIDEMRNITNRYIE